MSNSPKNKMLGARVRHEYTRSSRGIITQVRDDPRGYEYYVRWYNYSERSDWYKLEALIVIKDAVKDEIYTEAADQLDRASFRYGNRNPRSTKHGVNISDAKKILKQAISKAYRKGSNE